MKKLLFIFALVSLFSGRSFAQLPPVTITSMPCLCPVGSSGVIVVTNVPGATYYEWESMAGSVNAVFFNGSPGPVQTVTNSVNISCQLQMQFYVICVTAHNATDSSNTHCDTIWGGPDQPVLALSNNTIGIPGDSGIYAVDTPLHCLPNQFLWTLTGDATFNNNSQIITTFNLNGLSVNVNFGPNFTSGTLCVQAISNFGLASDTVCMTIYAPVGVNDIAGSQLSSYYQPNLQQVALEFSAPANQKISINSYDIAGRLVSQEQHYISPDTKEILVSTAGLRKGVYFVEVTGADFRKTLKIAVTN